MAGAVSKIEFFYNVSSSYSSSCNNAQRYVPCKSGGFSCSMGYPSAKKLKPLVGRSCSYSSTIYIYGRELFAGSKEGKRLTAAAYNAQMSIGIGKAQRWWEKGLQHNMKEITGAQDLVDSLLNAGDKLVIVDFFSPGCGGCKALHPKICQFAEMNPDVQFLQVNYEEHKSMCYSLNIHVLPFFRFYRGADGRLCSFSCTNATIKKLRDALAKHKPDRCSLGPPKGLEERELIALAANKDLSFNYIPKTEQPVIVPTLQETSAAERSIAPVSHPNPIPLPLPLPLPSASSSKAVEDREAKKLAAAGR